LRLAKESSPGSRMIGTAVSDDMHHRHVPRGTNSASTTASRLNPRLSGVPET
jgi:hypothetical protein